MDITKSPLYKDIKEVMDKGDCGANYGWDATIHCKKPPKPPTGDSFLDGLTDLGNFINKVDSVINGTTNKSSDEVTIKPLKILGMHIKRDYVSNYADEISVQMLIPMGDYANLIYPCRSNLEITLTRKNAAVSDISVLDRVATSFATKSSNSTIKSVARGILAASGIIDGMSGNNGVDRFTAVLLNQDRSPTVAQGHEKKDTESLNHQGLLQIDFQLIPKTIEKIQTMQIGGVLCESTLDVMIQNVITTVVKSGSGSIFNSSIKAVDVLPPSNTASKVQVVIPHGTPLVDFPNYLQNRIGVYNSGMGSYIQGKKWYTYYLYDTSKKSEREDTVTFIVVPPNKLPFIERTYMNKNGASVVLITGETLYKNDNDAKNKSKGTGARFVDSNALINAPVAVKGNKAVVDKSKQVNEINTGGSEITKAPMSHGKITSNKNKELTKLVKRKGGIFRAVWQTAQTDLLRPGVFAKILYDDHGKIKELNGILHHAEYYAVPMGGVLGVRYNNIAKLEFFVNPVDGTSGGSSGSSLLSTINKYL